MTDATGVEHELAMMLSRLSTLREACLSGGIRRVTFVFDEEEVRAMVTCAAPQRLSETSIPLQREWERRILSAGDQPMPMLTRRQSEVVSALSAGLSNGEIGRRLGISARTVELHLTRIYRRCGVNGRTALLAKIMKDPAAPADGRAPSTTGPR